ncbi:MAG: hypothetical protein JNK45_06850 [Myxococcales bacterium]|nr:hypothetical protein [Myxococcales bacterium]
MTTAAAPSPAFVGAFGLGHYLAYAERLGHTGRLEIRAGILRVGVIDLDHGVVVNAELPGAIGERALELLGRLRRAEVRRLEDPIGARCVTRPWQDFFTKPPELTASANEQLERFFSTEVQGPRPVAEPEVASPEAAVPRSLGESSNAYEQAFRDAVAAYARRDRATARRLFERCLELRPGDPRAKHNLERLGPEGLR